VRPLDLPVVVCPRSNMFFGMVPPLARMVKAGVTVALGTDNAMIHQPDLFVEMNSQRGPPAAGNRAPSIAFWTWSPVMGEKL
jgi:cytosine/adenosine deaminase-related metal-dependent hydrolase